MYHHREVHIVEVTEAQELRLAAEKLKPAGTHLAHSPSDIAILLSRYREQHYAPGQLLHHPGIDQAHGSAQQASDLSVMPARMRRSCRGISFGVAGDYQRV
jgi:hypothetical protein